MSILFTWELGGGIGHLMRIAPLARALRAKGHRVFLASKDFSGLEKLFAGSGVEYLPTPNRAGSVSSPIAVPDSFAHILHNVGFGDDNLLKALTEGWRNLYRLIRPDLIIFDHSPIALLAARGCPTKLVVIGSGFCIPPDVSPWPALRPDLKTDPACLKADEDIMLERVNKLLQSRRQPPLERMGQLFSQTHQQILTTFAELDHYRRTTPTRYWGPVNGSTAGGKDPLWPDVAGRRVYGYLKPFPALEALLQELNKARLSTLIYVDKIDRELQKKHASDTLRFETERLDIHKAAQMCDLAITNATLGTTTMMLMAGKPLLLLPLVLEQSIMARIVQQRRAGLAASTKNPAMVCERLIQILKTPEKYEQAAAKLATRFADFNPQSQHEAIIRRLESLLPRSDSPKR